MPRLNEDQVLKPVPSDIEISQAIEGSLPHISKVAEACGILESELEQYGRFKAKVGSLGHGSRCVFAESSCISLEVLRMQRQQVSFDMFVAKKLAQTFVL